MCNCWNNKNFDDRFDHKDWNNFDDDKGYHKCVLKCCLYCFKFEDGHKERCDWDRKDKCDRFEKERCNCRCEDRKHDCDCHRPEKDRNRCCCRFFCC